MNDFNVIAFPKPRTSQAPHDNFRDWMSWAECELAILGYDLLESGYDWRDAHARGMRPETAAAQAADVIERTKVEAG